MVDDSAQHREPGAFREESRSLDRTDRHERDIERQESSALDADQNYRAVAANIVDGLPVEFTPEERARHIYIVGRSGSGKSSLIFNLALEDVEAGRGVVFIDPHGDEAKRLLDAIPTRRTEDVCYIDVSDDRYAVGFNPLAGIPGHLSALSAANITGALKDIWSDSWGPRLEWFLNRGLALLAEKGDATLADLPPLFFDRKHRERFTKRITDSSVRDFWSREFPSYNDRYREDAQGPIPNKVGQLLASPQLRAILCQKNPKLDVAKAIERNQIIVLNLAKGRIGDEPANLLGSLFVSHLKSVAMARAAIDEAERTPVGLFVDEFQSFGTLAFAQLLSEARKYRLQLVIAHQFTAQLGEKVRASILGNAGTLVVFRVGPEDAELLHREFDPLGSTELLDQKPFRAWVKRGVYLYHCLVKTHPPRLSRTHRFRKVQAASRRRFARKF
jgi:DNA helicase HerA-like ATPase